MISSNVYNCNSTVGSQTGVQNNGGAAQPITTNGSYCPITVGLGNNFSTANVIDSASYFFVTGAGVTAGSVSIQILAANGGWNTATTPNSATGAPFTLVATLAASTIYNGSLNVSGASFFPCHGVRFLIAGLTGGNIIYAQLVGTLR